jgi:acylphosphatase
VNERLEIKVFGRVQGVAFRWYTQHQARALGLTGWVRNLPDGSVRIQAEGPRDGLQQLADWAARGPDRARVDRCELFWGEAGDGGQDFLITG